MSKTSLQLLDADAVVCLTRKDGVRVCILQCGSLSNICQVQVDVRVGDDAEGMERDGQRECAHYLEHLVASMLRSRKYPDGEAKTWVEEHGIYSNAFTSAVRTSHFMNGHCSKLREMIDIQVGALADFLQHGPHEFFKELSSSKRYELEKMAVVRELSGKIDSPEYKMYEAANAALYEGHPRSVSQRFDAENVLDLSPDVVRKFFEDHYVAGNIMITIAGPSSVCATTGIMEALDKYEFSKSAPKPLVAPVPFEKRLLPGQVLTRFVELAGSQTVRVTMAWPLRLSMYETTEEGRRRVQAVSALTNLLTGGFTSRFLKSLRTEQGLVYGISAGKSLDERDEAFGNYQIETSVDNENVEALVQGVFLEVSRMARDGPSEEEMQKYRTRIHTAIARRVSNRSPGSWVDDYSNQALFARARDFESGKGIVSNEEHFTLAKTVTAGDIQRAASESVKFFTDPMLIVIGAANNIEGLSELVSSVRATMIQGRAAVARVGMRGAGDKKALAQARDTMVTWVREKIVAVEKKRGFSLRLDNFYLPEDLFAGDKDLARAETVLRAKGNKRLNAALDELVDVKETYAEIRAASLKEFADCNSVERRQRCAASAFSILNEATPVWVGKLRAVENALEDM